MRTKESGLIMEPKPLCPGSFRSIKDSDEIVIDYETTGLPFEGDINELRVFAYSLTWVKDGYTEVYRYDFRRAEEFWRSKCTAIAHNLKFELYFTELMGWKINKEKILHDTMIMHQYIDNLSTSHALDYLFQRYAGFDKEYETSWKAVEKAFKIYGRYDKIPEVLMTPYQIADGKSEALLYRLCWPIVQPKDEYWNEIELIKTTLRMEKIGFMIEQKKAMDLIRWMGEEISSNETDAESIAGRYINLNSPAQISGFLYLELDFPNQGSTDNNAIEQLSKISNHPFLDCILKARAYTRGIKIVKDYIDRSKYDGAIHPSILTNRAATGRESSKNPNLQNVQKEIKAGAKYTVPARRCFRARPGYFLLLADYAGIEMRLGVQATGSKRLIQLCEQDFDFHDAFATSFYGDKYLLESNKDKKKAIRGRAKNGRFAMFYGSGEFTLAETLGLTVEEVRIGIKKDKKEFPEFYELMDKCTRTAITSGGIRTFFGRFLRVESSRPYTATDYLIQGSAAALFKHGQVNVDKFLMEEFGDEKVRCILPVHDELVMEMKRELLPDLNPIMVKINELMTDCKQITVPLKVEFSIATYTWDKKKEIKYAV